MVNANVKKTIFPTLTLSSVGYTFTPWSLTNPLRKVLGSRQAYLKGGNCFPCFAQVASQNQKDFFYGFPCCSFTFNLLSPRRTQQQQVQHVNTLKKKKNSRKIHRLPDSLSSFGATPVPLGLHCAGELKR